MVSTGLIIKSNAKVNLCLDVTGRRADGYHTLASVMQTVSLYDVIHMKKVDKPNYLKLTTNLPHLPVDERNIVYRAVRLMREKYDLPGGVFADIQKRIPVSAGLGGGSSNCAAAVRGVNALYGLSLPKEELTRLGQSLGADVPFFFTQGTALAEGIGEQLTPLKALPNCFFLLVRPPIIISTAEVFSRFRLENKKSGCDIEKMMHCLNRSDLEGVAGQFYNALETVTAADYPIIGELKTLMLAQGALGALMSGSGPTVFGCYKNKTTATDALTVIKKKYPNIKEISIIRNL